MSSRRAVVARVDRTRYDARCDRVILASSRSPVPGVCTGVTNGRATRVALLVAAALLYAPFLDHPFQYDDLHTIAQNAALHQPNAWKAAFTGTSLSSAETSGGHYRPLTYLTYWATLQLAGPRPAAFHAGNLILHMVAVWLVALVTARVAGSRTVGWFAAALMAVHPAHAEAVLYASARAGLLAATLALAAVWWWITARDRQQQSASAWSAWTLCAGFAGLALLAKETAIALPLLCLAVDRAIGPRGRASRIARWGPYLALAAAPAAFVALTGLWRPGLGALTAPGAIGTYLDTVGRQVEAIGLAARLWIWPWPLSVDHPLPAWRDPSARLPFAFAGLLVAIAVVGWRARADGARVAAASAGWTLAAALPTVLWPLNVPFQEHRSYLLNVGLASLTALAVVGAVDRRPVLARPAVAIGVAAWLLLAGVTANRATAWADPVGLWASAAATATDSFRAHTNHGLALAAAGRWEEAERALAAALALNPEYPPALVARGVTAQQRGSREAALADYERAIAVTPGYLPALYNLGLLAQEAGDDLAAERWYRRALAVNPFHAASLLNLGAVLFTHGRWEEAEAILTTARRAAPDSPETFYYLGLVAEARGNATSAKFNYGEAERLALINSRTSIAESARARRSALP